MAEYTGSSDVWSHDAAQDSAKNGLSGMSN